MGKLLRFVLASIIVTMWIFSGWPQIFGFPPKVQETQAGGTCATPTITLAAGPYTGTQTTTITAVCTKICYTTDGTTPTAPTAGTCSGGTTATYSSALTIDHTETIKAIATQSAKTNSSVASSAYTITVDTPTFGTNGGSSNNDMSSTISDVFTGATICYTTDGSTPGATTPGTCDASPTQTYSTAVPITVTGTVLKAIGTKSGSTNSTLATSNAFTLTVGAITSSPGVGTYPGTQSVALNIAVTTGAVAHYTTDGSAVTCSSPTYSGAFNISTTATVKAIGCKTNYVSSAAISDLYTITVPAAPTGVTATKTLSDRVTITWTKSTGATGYRVYRDAVDVSGLLGDVATYDDTGAGAPSITPGSAVAGDGASTAQVDLSLLGASANNGTTHTYKVVAVNAVGNSADSATDTGYRVPGTLTYQWQRSAGDSDATYSDIVGATTATYGDTAAPAPTITVGTVSATKGTFVDKVTISVSGASANIGAGRYYKAVLNATGATQQISVTDRGYRGVGALTYQWQRSAGDSDATYSDIAGATTATYDDTGAPADGSGRYYKVVENATGATQQISLADRGYRLTPIYSITITSSKVIEYGFVNLSNSTTTLNHGYTQTVQNDGNTAEKINVKSSDATGGSGWTLASAIGANSFTHEFSTTSGVTYTKMPDSLTYVTAKPSLAISGTLNFDFQLTTPSSSDYQQKSITITIQAVAP